MTNTTWMALFLCCAVSLTADAALNTTNDFAPPLAPNLDGFPQPTWFIATDASDTSLDASAATLFSWDTSATATAGYGSPDVQLSMEAGFDPLAFGSYDPTVATEQLDAAELIRYKNASAATDTRRQKSAAAEEPVRFADRPRSQPLRTAPRALGSVAMLAVFGLLLRRRKLVHGVV